MPVAASNSSEALAHQHMLPLAPSVRPLHPRAVAAAATRPQPLDLLDEAIRASRR